MIRVSTHVLSTGEVVVALEGHATASAITEIAAGIDAAGPRCTIDAAGLTGVDPVACEFLAGLRRMGVEIKGASMYIRALIEEPQP